MPPKLNAAQRAARADALMLELRQIGYLPREISSSLWQVATAARHEHNANIAAAEHEHNANIYLSTWMPITEEYATEQADAHTTECSSQIAAAEHAAIATTQKVSGVCRVVATSPAKRSAMVEAESVASGIPRQPMGPPPLHLRQDELKSAVSAQFTVAASGEMNKRKEATDATSPDDPSSHLRPSIAICNASVHSCLSAAAEHADHQLNAYVSATIASAWALVCPRNDLVSRARLQKRIEQEMHVPTTLDMLLHADPSEKMQKRSWSGNLESVSRCVAAHHHAFAAAEHDACFRMQSDICGHAYILKRGLISNADSTQFLLLLNRFIENRSFNMALRKIIDKSLQDAWMFCPIGRRPDEQSRRAVADLLEQCCAIIEEEHATLQTDMRSFRKSPSKHNMQAPR